MNSLLGNLGIKKATTEKSNITPAGAKSSQRGRDTAHASTGSLPQSADDKAKQSEERRYLIAAYKATPTLIPEFQNPQYMYKLISNEREYVQECLNRALAERKKRFAEDNSRFSEEIELPLDSLDQEIQEYRNDLASLFLLIKKVAGIQKSGTGGTDFLDPFKDSNE
ncbi:MAG: hypothetical protein HY692_08685 [Cyanobacteria bacterium NC_groundwater_1444_Ag_S-0.65um_54_12]|nr:hypothetical protein [Cyanobacteria bacterium NC_groundwater_1444_Ag_S-0.65um_54_12]